MHGQFILFPMESLDKKEALQDVMSYLNQWADALIIRHKNIEVMKRLAHFANIPIINAMSDINYPCEVISDVYALSKIRKDYLTDKYLFCSEKDNIAGAWKEAAQLMGLSLTQCCPNGYEMEGVMVEHALDKAMIGKDVILYLQIIKPLLRTIVLV